MDRRALVFQRASMKHEIQTLSGGSGVNLASIGGLNGVPYVAPYTAAKHAVVVSPTAT
jgi:NAD(P)-dependent dehydrogenase (short-subunit alcohol dehydrogenase family)